MTERACCKYDGLLNVDSAVSAEQALVFSGFPPLAESDLRVLQLCR